MSDISQLTIKGQEQAIAAAKLLKIKGLNPDKIYYSQIQRCRHHAAIMAKHLEVSASRVRPANDLPEVCYGHWEGKSIREVETIEGFTQISDWMIDAKWPASAGWYPTENEICRLTRSFIRDICEDRSANTILAVCNQVNHRAFLKLAHTQKNGASLTFKRCQTGSVSILICSHGKIVGVGGWNVIPPTWLDLERHDCQTKEPALPTGVHFF